MIARLLLAVLLVACSPPAREEAADAVTSPNAAPADLGWRTRFDFDGDGRPDRVTLEYTGGAHCCYLLSVALTSGPVMAIPFELEGGYTQGLSLEHPENLRVDVGSDGVAAFGMRIASPIWRAGRIPLEWTETHGVRSHHVRVHLRGGQLRVENLGWSCDEALELLARRAFDAWEGLAPDCSLVDVLHAFDGSAMTRDDVPLGEGTAHARHISSILRGLDLVAYHRDMQVVRIDLDEDQLGQPAADLVAALGPPEARLPYTLWGMTQPAGQWVWPSRGLVVYVDPEAQLIRHLGVFAPTDLSTYRRDLAWPSHP
jgi:hypothetical protein